MGSGKYDNFWSIYKRQNKSYLLKQKLVKQINLYSMSFYSKSTVLVQFLNQKNIINNL
jgi:hypothetical protein